MSPCYSMSSLLRTVLCRIQLRGQRQRCQGSLPCGKPSSDKPRSDLLLPILWAFRQRCPTRAAFNPHALRRGQARICFSLMQTGQCSSMPDQRPRRGAGLQLVELVLPRRQTGSQNGSHHQPGAAAGRRRQSHQTCRKDDPLSDPDARGQGNTAAVDRQYPQGSEPRCGSCGAVPGDGPMEDLPGLRCCPHRSTFTAETAPLKSCFGGVTAGFRLNGIPLST